MGDRKYLISGGAGFIGSHIAEMLIDKGLGDIVVFDSLRSGFEGNIDHIKSKVEFVREDIRDLDALQGAMEGVDIVFHEAAFVSAFDSINEPELTHAINVEGTRNVLEAAAMAGVKRVVLASSASIYGSKPELPNAESMPPAPESPYGESKLQNEIDAKEAAISGNVETVCLRYFNVFGPRQYPSSEYSGVISRFLDRIKSGLAPVVYGTGRQTRDFIYVEDVARANILASESENVGKGEVINIGTGRERSLLDLIDAFSVAFASNILPQFEAERGGDIKRSVADVTLAKSLLGFEADFDFNEGIRRLVGASI